MRFKASREDWKSQFVQAVVRSLFVSVIAILKEYISIDQSHCLDPPFKFLKFRQQFPLRLQSFPLTCSIALHVQDLRNQVSKLQEENHKLQFQIASLVQLPAADLQQLQTLEVPPLAGGPPNEVHLDCNQILISKLSYFNVHYA